MDTLHLIWNDLNAWIASITFFDIYYAGFIGLWLIILVMPLKGVDQRDPLGCLVYMVFMAACAATLLFALPNQMMHREIKIKNQFTTLMLAAAIGCLRWSIRYNNLKELRQKVLDFSQKTSK